MRARGRSFDAGEEARVSVLLAAQEPLLILQQLRVFAPAQAVDLRFLLRVEPGGAQEGSSEIGAGEVGAGEVGAFDVGAAEVGSGEGGAFEAAAGEVGAAEAAGGEFGDGGASGTF